MSTLIPQQRADKNGKIVTRHVLADSGASSPASSIPVPSIPVSAMKQQEMTKAEYLEAFKGRIKELGLTPDVSCDKLLSDFVYDGSATEKVVERLYDLLPKLDADSMRSLIGPHLNTTRYSTNRTSFREVALFSIAVMSWEYCNSVDQAALPGNYDRNNAYLGELYSNATDFFGASNKLRCTDETVADFEGYYLLKALKLDKQSFDSEGGYYRALTKLKDMRDQITPYLPVLRAMDLAYDGKNNYFFNDEYYLWENIKDLQSFPPEKVTALALETLRRGEYEEGLAEQIATNASDSLSDGLL